MRFWAASRPLITSWNARGISTREAQVFLYNTIKEWTPDNVPHTHPVQEYTKIVCIQETFLGPKIKCYYPNFRVLHCDRGTHVGGVAILIDNRAEFKRCVLPQLAHLEAVGVELRSKKKIRSII